MDLVGLVGSNWFQYVPVTAPLGSLRLEFEHCRVTVYLESFVWNWSLLHLVATSKALGQGGETRPQRFSRVSHIQQAPSARGQSYYVRVHLPSHSCHPETTWCDLMKIRGLDSIFVECPRGWQAQLPKDLVWQTLELDLKNQSKLECLKLPETSETYRILS